MADENSLLGTTGKEAIPYEYQVQAQKVARKRALAQAMLQRGLAPVPAPQMFGHHMADTGVAPYLLNAFQSYLGGKDLADAEAQDTALGQRMSTEKQGDLSKFQAMQAGRPAGMTPDTRVAPQIPSDDNGNPMPTVGPAPTPTPAVPPDVRGAIAQAMTSKWGDVRAQGQALQKEENDRLAKIAEIRSRGNLQAGVNTLQSRDPQAQIPITPPPAPLVKRDPASGLTVMTETGVNGEQKGKFAPVGTTVNVGDKTDAVLDKDRIARLSDSQKTVKAAQGSLGNIIRANQLQNEGSDVGGGASFRQALRKFGNSFGINIPETGLTDTMRSALGENLLEKVRAVAPVAGSDIAIVNQLVGSIDTDPESLKQLNAFLLAKTLMGTDLHNQEVEQVRATTSGTPSKYDAYLVPHRQIDTKDPGLLLRAYQYMKDSGHDMSQYSFDGRPVSDIEINMRSSSKKKADQGLPDGFTRPVR